MAAALALLFGPGSVQAQAPPGWDAVLIVDPFPPPYLSDWELNPTLASLTVTNETANDARVTIFFTVTAGDGRVVVSGRSEPQLIPAGTPMVFNTGSSLGGTSEYDTDIEDVIARTGRFPEDDYTACVTLNDASGFVIADNLCADFSTFYPDPPYLLFPLDRDTVTGQDPIFEWTPVQVPVMVQPFYVLQIAEMLPGQTPYQALTANILHFENPSLFSPSLQYPLGALPFAQGKRYAWWVQALDADGFPLSANQGRSEVWTFTYSDPGGSDPGGEEIGGSVKAKLVHTNRAGSGPLANLGSESYETVRDALLDAESGELRIPLPIPTVDLFDDLPLANVTVEYDDASQAIAIGATAALPLGNVNLLLLGLWDGSSPSFTLGIEPPVFDLTEWVSGLEGSPLGELDLDGAILTIGDAVRTLDASLLPLGVERFYSEPTIEVEVGVSLHQVLNLQGTTIAQRLAQAGVEVSEAELTGRLGVDPVALFGPPASREAPSLDLTATLRGASLADTPDWLRVERYTVRVTNDPALALTGEMEVAADLKDRTVGFVLTADLTELDGDADVVLTGRMTTAWDAPFGIEWLTLDSVTLTLTPPSQAAGTPARAVLSGQLALGSQPVLLTIELEGSGEGMEATFTASIDELAVADFLALIEERFAPIPFADQIPDNLAALRDIQLTFRSGDPPTFTALATASVLGQSTQLLYTLVPSEFTGGDGPSGLFGLRLADWSLGNLITALRGTSLGDFRFPAVSFINGPPGVPAPPDDPTQPGGGEGGWSIPWSSLGSLALDFLQPSFPCAGATGCDGGGTPGEDDGSALTLRPGLNFSAPISLSALMDLLSGLIDINPVAPGPTPPPDDEADVAFQGSPGISLAGLFSGDLDLSGLLDIVAVLPPIPDMPFGWPDWLAIGDRWLRISGTPEVGVSAHLVLDADLDGPKVFDLTAALQNTGEGAGGAFEGTMRGRWEQPFGLEWLTLDSVYLALSAGSLGPRAGLASAFDIGTVRAAVGIDVSGTSENRVLDFTASARNLSNADVVTLLNDAFDAGLPAPANPVTLDSLTIAFTTGDAASFHLTGGFSAGMDPLAALAGLVDMLPGVTAPDELPFELGTLAGAWFDLHVVPDSVWGGYGGNVAMGGEPGSAPFEGAAAIRLGGSRTAGSETWLALELDLAARDLNATAALDALDDALPLGWSLPTGLDALRNATLDSARLHLALDTRSDSASAEVAGAGTYAGANGTLAASMTLGLFDVGDSTWAHGGLTVRLADVAVSAALAQAASLLPGDWTLPEQVDALAPVQLDSASLRVGFDSRNDSLSAVVQGDGTMGGAGGLAASANLVLVQAAGDSWASGRLDLRIGTISIPEALAQAATLLPGDWTLPDAVDGLAPLVLDSATLGVAFDTRSRTFSSQMAGASHLGEDAARLDGSTEMRLLVVDDQTFADGRVTLGVRDLTLTGVLAQTAELLPGDWSLPSGFTAFDAMRLDSAMLEVGFDTRTDSLGAHTFGTGSFGDGAARFGATAQLDFARVAGTNGARGMVELARSTLTMTQAIEQVAAMLPGEWTLPDGLDAFDAVALDTARLVLGFDTWSDSAYAGVEGAGRLGGLAANARLDFVQVAAGPRASGLMTLSLGSVGAGDAIEQIANLLPGSWGLPDGFDSFNALTLDSASLHAGFDTQGDSLFAGFRGAGSLNELAADAQLGFALVGQTSYGSGLVTLTLGEVTLDEAFNRIASLLPGDWSVPTVDFDLGSLREVGLELGFNTRTDSIWAGVQALATVGDLDGRATLGAVSAGSASWVYGGFRVDVGDVTLPGALNLAASLLPGSPQVPDLGFDVGRITDAGLEAGFMAGDRDSVWAGMSGGFRLAGRSGRAELGIALGDAKPQGRFTAAFDDRFGVRDVVELFTSFLPGGGLELPPLGPLDIGLENPMLTLDLGERTGISFTGSSELFGKTADALFSAATIGGKPQLILGVQIPDLGFGDIVPEFENPVTDALRLDLAALYITQAEGEVEDENLSPEERRFFKPLMGGLDDFTVDFRPGLNLTGLIPLANAGAMKDMVEMLTPGAANLTLAGTIPLPGVGGLRDLALRAALPPMAPPGKPAWFVSGEIAVQITGRPSVGVAGALTVDVDGDTLTFDIESNVAIIPAGGVELSIAGGLTAKRPWVGPLGIDWLTLNEIRLAMGISPLAVRLGFLGDAVIGTKDIRMALGTKINIYTGVPTGAIVLGETEEGLSLGDLVSVAQQVAGEGADPISTGGVPDMAVRDLGLKIATYSDFDLGVEAGFSMSGAFFLQAGQNAPMKEMGRIELDIGLDGIVGLARLAAFRIGPVAFDDALLDLALTIPDQHLIIQGGATIDNFLSADVSLAMSRDSFAFETDFDLFGTFRALMEARAAFDLLNPQFYVRVALYPEFLDQLTLGIVRDVIPVGQAVLDAAAATLNAATATLDAAQQSLDTAIWAAGEAARLAMNAAYNTYRYARDKYNYANSKYRYYRDRCSWRRPWYCASRDYWRSVRAFWSGQKSIAWYAYVAARAVYENREFLENNPVVDAARRSLDDARASFNAALAEVNRMQTTLGTLAQWIATYESCSTCPRPAIPVSVISAEFEAALAGFFGRSRVNVALTYQVFGDRRTLSAGFGGSIAELVQPLFNAVSDALF